VRNEALDAPRTLVRPIGLPAQGDEEGVDTRVSGWRPVRVVTSARREARCWRSAGGRRRWNWFGLR